MDCLKSPAIFPGYRGEQPLSLFQAPGSRIVGMIMLVKSKQKYIKCMIWPWEKGVVVSSFSPVFSHNCSFVFVLYHLCGPD